MPWPTQAAKASGTAALEIAKVRGPFAALDFYAPAIKQEIYDSRLEAGDLASLRWDSARLKWPFIMAIVKRMDVSIADAKNRLTQLVRAVEEGEFVVITRNGKPVAQLTPAPPNRRKVLLGSMRGRIRLLPGWDDPVDLDRFLNGDL
jgi:prevent-host-death family protein